MMQRHSSTAGASLRALGVAWVSLLLTTGCNHDGGLQMLPADASSGSPRDSTFGTGACVDVSHVGATQKNELEVIGTGFEADEGQMIRIIATQGAPTYGLGEAPIQNGSFDIVMPGVLGDYTGLAVHVDKVRNEACDPDKEFIWQMTTGPASSPGLPVMNGRTVWKVSPNTLSVFNQVGPCSLNGIFDLTIPLVCVN
jgi:hypothetical protein